MWRESTTSKRRAGQALLIVGILLISSVGPVLAAPQVFVTSASVEQSRVVPGEPVNVSFQLKNTGDSGASSIPITANGSAVFSQRYQVDSDETRSVTEQITFEEPGRYRIRVNDENAGWVRVEQTLAETTDVRSEGRSMVVRGGRIPYNTVLTTTFPTTNESVAVESLTYRSLRSSFDRTVELYTNASAAPFAVPSGDATTVYGAVTVQSRSGIDDQRIRFGVNRSTVNESQLTAQEVHVYRPNGENYARLNTTLVGTEDDRYVFEAPTNDTGTLLVGSLAPSFEVTGHSLSTSVRGTEKRITVTANVTNTGSVAGNYTGDMRIDGTVVNNTTVALAPGESRPIRVSHGISRDGTYQVSLGDEYDVTVIVDTGEGGQDETPTEDKTPTDDGTPTDEQSDSTETTTDTTDGDGTATEAPSGDGSSTASEAGDGSPTGQAGDGSPTGQAGDGETTAGTDSGSGDSGISLSADDVGLTEIAIGGSVAVIGVILVLLQRW